MRIHSAAMFLAAFGLAITPAATRAAATPGEAAPAATLTVTGRGQISRAPDLATVAVTIVTNDDSAARALSENNRRFSALGAKLGAAGIGAGDISSTSLASYFNPRPTPPAPNAPGQLFGYIVTRNVQINVNSLGATGSVVDAATAAGATQINGISYGIRDRRAVERAALAAAVTDAYEQAQTIAGAAHVQIVRILRIDDETNGPGRVVPLGAPLMRMKEDAVPTTIGPSDLDVSSSVSVTYMIR